MQKIGVVLVRHRKGWLGAAGLAALTMPFLIGPAGARPGQSQSQAAPAAAPVFEYEVASFKPSKPQPNGMIMIGSRPTPDGFSATNLSLKMLVQQAYGVNDYQISGGPDWLASDRYDIEAKMDGSVADALQKLSPDDRTAARRQMLQALLADRLKLTIHRDTKDLPTYTLMIGKNGSKLKEATPGEIASNTAPAPGGGRGGAGTRMTAGPEGMKLTAQAAPIANLVSMLSGSLRRPVLDKTGLTGKYDFTLNYTMDAGQTPGLLGGGEGPSGGSLTGPPTPGSTDTSAPILTIAIQEQLGLKLESGKGPVEIIVIDHIEKPSDN